MASRCRSATGDLREVSFVVPDGLVTGFLGPNGAGKTTTLRMVLGLARPSQGSALLDGVRYAELHSPRRRVGAVLELSGFHPWAHRLGWSQRPPARRPGESQKSWNRWS